MPRDQRWTGGLANREWSRGQQAEHIIDHDRIKADVAAYLAAYLADCRASRAILRASDHPTVEGCLKAVWRRWPEERDVITAEYQRQTSHLQAVTRG